MQDAQSLLQAGDYAGALVLFEDALAHDPNDLAARFGRGTAYNLLGRPQEAKHDFDAILARHPDIDGALNNRGDTLLALDQPEAALMDYERAIALTPAMAPAHLGRGIALQRLNRLDEALASFDRALALDPHLPAALDNRATLLLKRKRFAEAAAGYAALARFAPGASLNGMAFAAAQICDWRHWRDYQVRIAAALTAGQSGILPSAPMTYCGAPALMQAAARNVTAGMRQGQAPLWRHRPFSGAKIRLGYVSNDFNSHATARLMAEVWERHDRSRFELIAFDFGPDDGSAMRARVKKAFDRFYHLPGESAAVLAAQIAEAQVDIALDLKGLTGNARTEAFALRPAPVQVNYLGYPGTMGADFMDYILADAVTAPLSHQPFYSEKILHLPDCYQPNDSRRARPPAPSRAQVGLPETGFVFCCFNRNWKINPLLFDIWMRLLKAVPGSVLWLFGDNPAAMDNLRREAVARGVDGKRLVFAPQADPDAHLARHAHAGLMLDTLPCNAHTTASDALWMGVPLVTCLGEGFAGRVAASLLTAIGMTELVTENLDAYESLARTLTTDPARLAAVKQKLEANRRTTPLFDTARYTAHLEELFEQMRDAYLTR